MLEKKNGELQDLPKLIISIIISFLKLKAYNECVQY